MFIKEVMRMWPPVPLIGRINEKEFTTAGKTVPEKSWLEIGIWVGAHAFARSPPSTAGRPYQLRPRARPAHASPYAARAPLATPDPTCSDVY
jgi:hypothetical protein